MGHSIVSLVELDDEQVMELARLHYAVMHSLLTELGVPFLERYYQLAQTDGSVLGFCAISEKGNPLGWVIGSPKPDQLNGRLREALTWFIQQMLRLLFTRPRVLWQLALSVLSSSGQSDIKEDAIELIYIGVSGEQKGTGIGTKLVDCFITASREAGYHSVILSVEVDNPPAIALYKKTGFEIIRTFSEGRYQRHRMELKI